MKYISILVFLFCQSLWSAQEIQTFTPKFYSHSCYRQNSVLLITMTSSHPNRNEACAAHGMKASSAFMYTCSNGQIVYSHSPKKTACAAQTPLGRITKICETLETPELSEQCDLILQKMKELYGLEYRFAADTDDPATVLHLQPEQLKNAFASVMDYYLPKNATDFEIAVKLCEQNPDKCDDSVLFELARPDILEYLYLLDQKYLKSVANSLCGEDYAENPEQCNSMFNSHIYEEIRPREFFRSHHEEIRPREFFRSHHEEIRPRELFGSDYEEIRSGVDFLQ